MKKGISLIVLVITIIVMIIIAGAIIISLNSTNIIDRANEATTKSDVQALNSKLNLAYIDLKLDNPDVEDFSGSVKVGETTYNSATEYYKDVVPEVDSAETTKYAIPSGYKLTVDNTTGAAIVEK